MYDVSKQIKMQKKKIQVECFKNDFLGNKICIKFKIFYSEYKMNTYLLKGRNKRIKINLLIILKRS